MRDRARESFASGKHAAQQLKHRAFLAYKPYRFRVAGAVEPVFRAAHKLRPYRLDPNDWPGTHLPHNEPLTRRTNEALPRRIFVFWTGDNAVSAQRQRGIDSLRALNPSLDVVLITPENLDDYVFPGHPFTRRTTASPSFTARTTSRATSCSSTVAAMPTSSHPGTVGNQFSTAWTTQSNGWPGIASRCGS
ncbi:hypothetical protein GCM10025872_27070 [Barrientosiimonas endolithica]|uniref:Uncharacterized protein n=1 Tax=Barrientosiimonas endolithica TaxID=1535208 RepID=A0ABM8HDL7_9MICO|nr:hypothetical protein GCM10025872_27070 [Barrientosiimonas endolithica]